MENPRKSSLNFRDVSSDPLVHPSKEGDSKRLKMIKILLAALPSIVFGVFTIIFTIQQNHTANENRKLDESQSIEQSIRSTFENYIDDISKLLLDAKFNRGNSEHLLHIRVKTLTVLRNIDANRKRDIILFLYESRLLRSDALPNERLDLKDADLGKLEFLGSPDMPIQLDHLFLPGVQLSNGIFQWCMLDHAVFDKSSMMNAKIVNSSISYTSFRRVYAPDMVVGDLIFHQNNFSGAVLIRMFFISGADWKEGVDMTNADLFGIHDSKGPLVELKDVPPDFLIFRNTRSADGLFYELDSSDLVIDGGAEIGCQAHMNKQVWGAGREPSSIKLFNGRNHSSIYMPFENGDCYFLAQTRNRSSLIQLIDVSSFSVLISSGHAGYNISAYMGCSKEQTNLVSIDLAFLKPNLLWIDTSQALSNNRIPQQVPPRQEKIPPATRIIRIELYTNITEISSFCMIDNIKLNIFDNKEGELFFN